MVSERLYLVSWGSMEFSIPHPPCQLHPLHCAALRFALQALRRAGFLDSASECRAPIKIQDPRPMLETEIEIVILLYDATSSFHIVVKPSNSAVAGAGDRGSPLATIDTGLTVISYLGGPEMRRGVTSVGGMTSGIEMGLELKAILWSSILYLSVYCVE